MATLLVLENLLMKITKLASILLIVLFILVAIPTHRTHAATGPICYVKTGASGTGDSWSDAYPDLQSALADSNCSEIWVATGTYYPDEGTGQVNNDRSSTFTLKNGVSIYGGFDGTETARGQRDPGTNTTTLSGDINQSGDNSGNVYHVVTSASANNTAILDGFTISSGNANGGNVNNSAQHVGGGMYNHTSSSPSLSNITFDDNSAEFGGGGMYNHTGSSPTLTNVTFSGNSADEAGGMYNVLSSNPTLSNVTFSGNSAIGDGSATSHGHGGGMYNTLSSSPTLKNVTFSGNTATFEGGGLYNALSSNPTLENVILWGNSAGTIGDEVSGFFSTPNITDSVVKGGCPTDAICTNIISSDPKLGSLANNGGYTKTIALGTGSSAIDAGGVNTTCANNDQRGISRPIGAACDIGAYEAGASILIVTNTTPASGATVSSATTIIVNFNEDAMNDSSNKAANNTANYILVEAGANGSFDTASCADGVAIDDIAQSITNATYTNNGGSGPFSATLSLSSPLNDGNYRLYICGTTSIWSVAGLELNNGNSDTQVNFTIGSVSVPSSLPETGFPMGEVTRLDAQPATKTYTTTELVLEIPSLNMIMPIVGVPQSTDGWDVTWLGNSAGYLYGSAFPTWTGNTVLTGHVWDAWNQPGPFAELKTLSYGDQFYIRAWGLTYTYEVRENKLIRPKNIISAFEHEEYDWVTLLTCEHYNPFPWGDEYFHRRLVRAVLVDVR